MGDNTPLEAADLYLEGLRRMCGPDAYRLVAELPDTWIARCPLHPDSGYTLVVAGRDDDEPKLWCRVGCPERMVRRLLLGDPELDLAAEAAARVLTWKTQVTGRLAERGAA